jgi:hypothetical protein
MTEALPCGCVSTKRGGHTHTKLCPQCKAAAFPVMYGSPAPQDPAARAAWLKALRQELS